MKILVIGASGMLAKPVVKKLDEAGFEIRLFSRTVNSSMYEKDYEIVNGDVFVKPDLERAMDGCDAMYITLSKLDESAAVKSILEAAKKRQIKVIGLVSGASVSEKNRWFWMIDNKFQAEQAIINSGIPYIIFRPTWFMESLSLMVRDGRAMLIGKQPNPSRWLAADDFGRMVATAFQKTKAQNKIFYCYGPEKFLMKDILTKYCVELRPEVKKVSSLPIGLMKFIAFLTGKKELKMAISMFAYFEKAGEITNNSETDEILGKPEIAFDQWIKTRKK